MERWVVMCASSTQGVSTTRVSTNETIPLSKELGDVWEKFTGLRCNIAAIKWKGAFSTLAGVPFQTLNKIT